MTLQVKGEGVSALELEALVKKAHGVCPYSKATSGNIDVTLEMLGFVNRVVIARFIGEEGVGLYMMAAPTFFLATTLTQFGLPVAISKLVAEASARGDHQKRKIF